MATNLHNGQSSAKPVTKTNQNQAHTQVTKPVAIPALTVLENQLDAQNATLNDNAEALIRAKMQEMKGNLHNTVVNTMSEYAEMSDFFDFGGLFNTAPMLEPTTPETIGQMQESIEVQAQAV